MSVPSVIHATNLDCGDCRYYSYSINLNAIDPYLNDPQQNLNYVHFDITIRDDTANGLEGTWSNACVESLCYRSHLSDSQCLQLQQMMAHS